MIRKKYYWIFLAGITLGWCQSANQLETSQVTQLRRSILRDQMDQEKNIQRTQSLDDLLKMEEQFDSTNVPVKIIITPSEIEEYYRLKLARIREDIIGLNVIETLLDSAGQLTHFGYDYFYNFEQRELWERTIPPNHYELGSGDEIIISIWGETERREKKIIARDGSIFVNDIGIIKLGGKTISQAQNYIEDRLGTVYETIHGNNPKTFVNLTHGKISGKTVTFTGHVKVPGMHVVTPYVDPITALIYAGGIDTTGSLRQILFYRNESLIDTLDFYKYLIDGLPLNNLFMRDGDRLHVPRRLQTITVSGDVYRPAHYELKPNESLLDAMTLSGGPKNIVRSSIHLKRNNLTEEKENLFSKYLNFEELAQLKAIDGDSISVNLFLQPLAYIYIYGLRKTPIELPFAENISLEYIVNVIANLDTFINGQKWLDEIQYESEDRAQRVSIPAINSQQISFKLKPNDRITFFMNPLYGQPGNVKITGAVNNQGTLPINKHGQSLKSVISLAGGIRDNALKEGIQIYRDSLRLGWKNESMLILSGDSINVLYDQGTIEILGEVNAPGIYDIGTQSISVKRALAMAGGLNPNGSKKNMFIIYSNGMVQEAGGLFAPSLRSGSSLIVSKKSSLEYRSTLETTEKLAGIVGSLATLLLVINSTAIGGN